MPFFPAFLEFLGTTEMLVIAVVALVIFGPRRLPEIGRKVGKSLAEFKRASEDFKRTWEREVEIDRIESEVKSVSTALDEPVWPRQPALAPTDGWAEQTVARNAGGADTALADAAPPPEPDAPQPAAEAPQKHDWL